MTGSPRFTERQKASAFIVLAANDNNITRTSRETGIPESTLRRWRNDWDREGSPDVSEPDVARALEDYVGEATLVRDFALTTLKLKIPDAKPGELITIIGVLDDKVTRARGLATTRTEHVHRLPSREEIAALIDAGSRQIAEATIIREDEIVDAEVYEVKRRHQLPSAT